MLSFRPAETNDAPSIKQFVAQAGLSSEGIEQCIQTFIILETDKKKMAGTVGLERNGDVGLIRSLVLDKEYSSEELLLRLLKAIIRLADHQGVQTVYLLTRVTSIFYALGFTEVPYDQVPEELLNTPHLKQYDRDQIAIMKRHLVEMG
ncbi:GNAT family N-acetyltransferase [Pseudalkalibacillus sp. SCS-8]|uniref:GNAT family N-acetyltransferase n=1 Tax=Pseudalkalibacillus nanhaiensis TaxID=3115291 RepID=UPI0032DB5BD1